MKYAILDSKNIVVSMVIWPNGVFNTPDDHTAKASAVAEIGDSYKNGKFMKPDGSVRR